MFPVSPPVSLSKSSPLSSSKLLPVGMPMMLELSSEMLSIFASAVPPLLSFLRFPSHHINWCIFQCRDHDHDAGVVASFEAITLTSVYSTALSPRHCHFFCLCECKGHDGATFIVAYVKAIILTLVSFTVLCSFHWHPIRCQCCYCITNLGVLMLAAPPALFLQSLEWDWHWCLRQCRV